MRARAGADPATMPATVMKAAGEGHLETWGKATSASERERC